MELQPVSETGCTVAIAVTFPRINLFLLHCGGRFRWLIVINMVSDNKKECRDAKHAPTDQFNYPCKDNRHNNSVNLDKINIQTKILPRLACNASLQPKRFMPYPFFSDNSMTPSV